MNSLNILSARVSPPGSPAPSRSNSYGNIFSTATVTEARRNSRENIYSEKDISSDTPDTDHEEEQPANEETPLLNKESPEHKDTEVSAWLVIPRRISASFIDSLQWILHTLAAPGVYLIACLYDERGQFAPFTQIRKLGSIFHHGGRRGSTAQTLGISADEGILGDKKNGKSSFFRRTSANRAVKGLSTTSSSSGMSSESESDQERSMSETDPLMLGPSHHTRSKSLQSSDEIAPAKRSIRIKLHNEDSVRQRKHRKSQSTATQSNGAGGIDGGEISPATLKSPTSPASSLSMTKYPRAPAPPRPLIPRRQPSYSTPEAPKNGRLSQKTLILDLDETLIHSMAKGGRMSTGHMVEVKINHLMGVPGNMIGPQHPILYYVHKRPHCDDFLRRVSSEILQSQNYTNNP